MSDQNTKKTIQELIIDGETYVFNATYLKNGDKKFDLSDIKTINGEAIIKSGGGDIVTPITYGEVEGSAVLKGGNNTVTGKYSAAIGYGNTVKNDYSVAFGYNTIAKNVGEHASGIYNVSNGDTQFSIGVGTSEDDRKNAFEVKKNGDIYIGGVSNTLQSNINNANDAIDILTGDGDGSVIKIVKDEIAKVVDSAPEKLDTLKEISDYITSNAADVATTLSNHSESIKGLENDSIIVKGNGENSAVLKGGNNIATGVNSFAEGGYTKALSEVAHAEGLKTISGRISQLIDPTTGNIRELTDEEISTLVNEALRIGLITSQNEFNNNVAMKLIGFASHSEGSKTKALGTSSHAEGNNTEASSNSSHAEGDSTHAWGESSHAEGYLTEANGNQSHSEGKQTKAQGNSSHAEGIETQANGWGSHAEGNKTIANGSSSHTEGLQTITNNIAEHASGQYNKSTKSTDKAEATHFSIGIGTSANDRKNAFEVKQNGDIYIEGIGGFIGDNYDKSEDVATVISQLEKRISELENIINNQNYFTVEG